MAVQKQRTFFLLETPPHTPASDSADSHVTFRGMEIELKTRTPRKPDNPQQTPVHENNEGSAVISFKFIQSKSELTPELKITSTTPVSLSKRSRAKRRLWSGDSEPLDYIDLDIKQKKSRSSEIATELLSDSKQTINPSPYFSPSDRSDTEDNVIATSRTPKSYSENTDSHFDHPSIECEKKYYSLKCSRTGSKSKMCASCSTRKTPLWRDSDDGTPYCNACGIRFKKYRVRCSVCLYIPRKDEKTNNCCYLCGSQLERCRFSGHSNY